MISKIFICTDDINLKTKLFNDFKIFPQVEVLLMSRSEYLHNSNFDIINTPTSILEEFGSVPNDIDCKIYKTHKKYGMPEFAASSPNFIQPSNLSYEDMAWYQIVKPLEAALKFSNEQEIIMNYALHTENAFGLP